MFKKVIILSLMLNALSSICVAIETRNIIAYPVPFNLNLHDNIKIDFDPSKPPETVSSVKIEIFDVNGDRVFSRDYPVFPVIWNGRNNNGKKVKAGLYIIKVTVENNLTGGFGTKAIRILVVQ